MPPITFQQRVFMARYLRRNGITPQPLSFVDAMIRLYESLYPPDPAAPGTTVKETPDA